MLNSGILEVAIGLIFIFLLLSLICTAMNEIIESWLKMRASDMEKGIRGLLHDPQGTGLANKIYNHPLVFGLFEGKYDPKKKSNLPSYMPSRNFALALMDIVLPADQTTVSGAESATVPPAAAPSPAGSGTPPSPLQPLRDAISSLNNPEVEKALRTLVDAAGNDINKARENIEGWFNSAMERITGWYKRRTQWIVLGLGFAVAIAVNADTITIARSLSYDTALRNALVAVAQESAKAPLDTGRLTIPAETRLKQNLEEIQKLGLPIGWKLGGEPAVPKFPEEWTLTSSRKWSQECLLMWSPKILGWVLTAMAISLGAPFWFDLLNKFMTARSTIKPTKPEEPQKA